MMTNLAATGDCLQDAAPAATAQRVVIVNGNMEMLELLDRIVDAARYDIVFVETSEHAYSQIKRLQPHLVLLCVRIDDVDGFQVLSMLKLDDQTRGIPVLTYTTEYEGQKTEEEVPERSETQLLAATRAVRMN